MTPIVALIAPGNMGSGVAQRLTENKVKVLTSLAGRSEASAKRARAAGMAAVTDAQLTEADFLMSIVPPGDALGLAKRLVARADRRQQETGLHRMQCGQPAHHAGDRRRDRRQPVAPSSAPASSARRRSPARPIPKSMPPARPPPLFAKLNDYGLIVRVLEGPLTAASALKMSYAGITKGFTALGAAMMLAATRGGSAEALKAELAESRPAICSAI